MGQIRIFSDTKSGKVTFDGSTVTDKEIGSVEAAAHPTQSDRIIIRSTRIFKRGSTTEYRVFLKRLKDSRVQNEAGQTLTDAPTLFTRDQVVDYLNDQMSTPIITEYFEYNPTTDRLVAQRDVQVDKNGFFLGEKHKMASGGSNIYFEDLDNSANSYPIFGEVLDQSLSANQLPGAGVTLPKSRIFQDFNPVPLGGNPVDDTSIDYDGNNFFPFNISGQGITTRAGEALLATQQLKYEIVINGISVYVQYLQPGALSINDPITWYFDQPLDIEAGTTLRATIYKVSIVNNQETIDGIFKVNEGDAVPTRYQTQVLARLFTDKQIALKEDVDQLLNGSIYKGSYDATGTGTPTLPTGTDVLGDFYRITTANSLSGYNTGDILVFNGTDYDHVAEASATQSDIKNSALRIYDIYVKADYLGAVQDGSVLYPYPSLETAIASANDGDQIYVEGVCEISGEITLPNKSLFFYGSDDAVIKYTNYSASNANLMRFTGTDNTKEFKFKNITFMNAGGYALYIQKTSKVEIDDCTFTNNGWNGTALNTVLPSTTTALLGYDSTSAELQAFYAGANASNGGAMRIEEATQLIITANTVTKNLRGIRVSDCGVGGAGVITRNQSTQNIESGIYLSVGALGGCQNISVAMNVTAYNANNGLLIIGGLNNKFSQNEVNGNWNAGFCAWGAANSTLRDCGLYDNNRSAFNGIGNTGDAKASIQINEAYNLLGTSITLNPAARFIAEILDTQVHYTGLGSNTERIGFLISSAVGGLADDDKNIIKVDDVGFIGQDYAIDLSEVDVSNLRLSLGDNSYQTIGVAAVKPPLVGNYSELPFSNHVMSCPSVNVEVDVLNQSVKLKEYVSGNVINVYHINELAAVENGTTADILQKDSDKIQLRGLTLNNVYVNGVVAGNTVTTMVNTLNSAFAMDLVQYEDFLTTTVGVASAGELEELLTFYYIESPDGVFTYPLFATDTEANTFDLSASGTGNSNGYTFPDEPTNTTWNGPVSGFTNNATSAPSNGLVGAFTSVIWNEIPQDADSGSVPSTFSAASITLDELTTLNNQVHPLGAQFTSTIANAPAWITQSQTNGNITGTAPSVTGDNTNYPSETYTVDIVRTNDYGSSTGVLTIVVNNLNAALSLTGDTVHTGSAVAGSVTNSAGNVFTGNSSLSGQFVMDLQYALEDGDKLEWYHQEQYIGIGIVSSGVDKTTDILDKDSAPGSRWDLLAPFTGVPSNSQGQNFGNVYGMVGLVPVGWDNNTNPQAIPTRPVYNSSDVWSLFNNAGTIELSLNGVLFRSSSSTHTDPTITFATPAFLNGVTLPIPSFTHTANAASVPSGFTLINGSMDTTTELAGDSVAKFDNLTLSPGQRLIIPKTYANTNILPVLDGASGEDNKAFIGIPKFSADWASVDLQTDFFATHRWENNTIGTTGMTMWHAGSASHQGTVNHASDTDTNFHMAIEYTRGGDIAIMRATDATASLTTEPLVGGTFAITPRTWTDAQYVIGLSAQPLVAATKGAEAGITLTETGLSIIDAPLAANEFNVTEDTSSLPLFNGDPAGDITLNAGQTYKFWLTDSSIESTDALGICLVSDNSNYTTGVTVVGTPGEFGSYLEFVIPSDVPPVKFKWTSNGVAYYVTPVVAGSTYSAGITGITQEGPSANQTGTNIMDQGDHGWISLNETLAAGERLVLDNAFFTDFFAEVGGASTIFAIGLKGDNWTNTKEINNPQAAISGEFFKGNTYMVGQFSSGSGSSVTMNYVGDGVIGNSMLMNTTSQMNSTCAFLEILGNGNSIRLGFGYNGNYGITAGDESTVPYGDWSAYGAHGSDATWGITNLDVVMSFWTYNGGDIDGAEIDWTGITEVAAPAAPTNSTSWTKALDFSGGSEYAKLVGTHQLQSPLRMWNLATTAAGPLTSGYTSNDSSSRPWATAIVFKADRNNSNQHIWNSGEGASSGNDNIYLRLTSGGQLLFGWGRDGTGYNECEITQYVGISSSVWYGVYITSNGTRLNANDATSSNLADAFDIRLMSSSDGFTSVGSNLSTSSRWTNTGYRMDRSTMGDFTIGGRSGNRNFHGKVASMVVTTLKNNQVMPTDAEITKMITDPQGWVTDYKLGQTYHSTSQSGGGTMVFPSALPTSVGDAFRSTQVWLMGEGSSDSFANGMRNYIYPFDGFNSKLQLNSMSSNDIETVTITGLT